MKIYIPTYKRIHKQITWDQLPGSVRKDTVLVVHKNEEHEHRQAGRNVLVSPRQGLGMAAIRGWILDHALKSGTPTFAIVDDDLRFQIRQIKQSGEYKIVNSTPAEIVRAFAWLEHTVSKEVHHAAFSARALLFREKGEYTKNVRTMHCIAYRSSTVRLVGARFDKDVPDWFPMDDFHMNLQMLRAGHANRVSLVYKTNPAPSNAPGGCSEQRTAARQTESSKLLSKLHPGLVRLREKKAWRGMESIVMYDVTVAWKQALKYGSYADDKSTETHKEEK